MATQNLSSFDPLLKDVYRGVIVEQLNNESYLLDKVQNTNANDLGAFNGRRLIFAVHAGRNRGHGAVTDGGTLNVAGKQSNLDGIVTMKYFDQAIELTDIVIRQSQGGNVAAFAKALTYEMDGALTDMKLMVNRMAYGTGDGLLGSCTATQSATTISLDSGQSVNVGDTVDVLTRSNGAVKGAGLTVTAVAYTGTKDTSTQANADITLSSSVSVTSADGVYLAGDRSNESDGLRNITSTSRTLHGINSATAGNEFWNSNATAAAFVNVSEDLLMQTAQTIRQRSGKQIDSFVTTYGVQRRLANFYQSQKRWNDDRATTIDGGYSVINVSAGNKAVPVIADTDCVNGYAFALAMDTFAWSELASPDWLQPPQGGSIFHLKDGSTAGTKQAIWQAWIAWYATLVNVQPNRNGQISQLKDDVPIPHV